jgi:predicted O-methyltransferase YrrM
MSDVRWDAVDDYVERTVLGPDAVLDAVRRTGEEAGLPPIAVSPSQGRLLTLLARAMGARRILELGTLAGYSTVCLARALPSDGRLVTIEVDARHAEVARRNFSMAEVASMVDLRVGAALDVLPQLAAEQAGLFDFTFIDADKAHYPEYLDWALKLARPGGLIVADNVVRKGELANDDSTDPAVRAVRRFMDRLSLERAHESTVIQTVGSKGYDGLAIILAGGQPVT